MASMNRHVSAATLGAFEKQVRATEIRIKDDTDMIARLEEQLAQAKDRIESNEEFKADLQLLIDIAPRKG